MSILTMLSETGELRKRGGNRSKRRKEEGKIEIGK
jgi:hypothetical protein